MSTADGLIQPIVDLLDKADEAMDTQLHVNHLTNAVRRLVALCQSQQEQIDRLNGHILRIEQERPR